MDQRPWQRRLRPKKARRRQEKSDKRIDLQLKRKEQEGHIGGAYFRDFGDEIPLRPQNQDQTDVRNNTAGDNESTTSSNQVEAVATHEPGVYSVIPVQDYRDGPIVDIAVHYVRINCEVEQKATRNKQQEDNVRAADLYFMLDLETLIRL